MNHKNLNVYLKKETGGVLSGILLFFVILIIIAVVVSNSNSSSLHDFQNDELEKNLVKVLQELDMDPDLVTYPKQLDDWQHGNLYSFTYDTMKTYYIYAYENGEIVSIKDSLSGPSIYENKNITMTDENSNAIILQDGQLGEYGRYVTYNGTQYIKYFVPEGTYEAKSLVKGSMFFIESTKIYKNYAGYDESEVLSTVNLINKGDTETITISPNTCINLTIGTNISLIKK